MTDSAVSAMDARQATERLLALRQGLEDRKSVV